ncbi:glutaredoxin-C9-like [Impatiens glandulifera]|uniref:glutaredoxin-C9-like n=1 Tax=Impatiens glandulifera TaxID=253017 RepID=UPI001FB0709B|nr:glutaredoxin-C9-like [Impatiens glandulifera]
MQEAIPYKSWLPTTTSSIIGGSNVVSTQISDVKNLVSENAAIVLGRRGCCLSHVVKRLLLGLGANPATYEIDEEDEKDVIVELERLAGGGLQVQLPVVFIGGRLFGGLDRIMATHITGELIPVLKQAGALWL